MKTDRMQTLAEAIQWLQEQPYCVLVPLEGQPRRWKIFTRDPGPAAEVTEAELIRFAQEEQQHQMKLERFTEFAVAQFARDDEANSGGAP